MKTFIGTSLDEHNSNLATDSCTTKDGVREKNQGEEQREHHHQASSHSTIMIIVQQLRPSYRSSLSMLTTSLLIIHVGKKKGE
ncbi:hypothetical protein JHK82_053739 [Glycine max]|uniref:Uncharacterized protein n=2 Tax=Glycine subgen. Soja TaxID=1462606 RepID=A0A0R0EMP9_SOYBN|nr:hypothetical protein JHK86_053587 [Glycine max]KHN10664.1 hypothetical protein glysoja_019095 [Glycine soja]KAG4928050.1 hypothetical protein JHK85_054536 [Glycine max]KAG5083574.1 hypothetical protein JHK84_053612 [Glycine max]KAG5086342.1 hypothetical protein JHK82_053739 [Glycine max]